MPLNAFGNIIFADLMARFSIDDQSKKGAASAQRSADKVGAAVTSIGKKSQTAALASRMAFQDIVGSFTSILIAGRVKDVFLGAMAPAANLEHSLATLSGISGIAGDSLDRLTDAAFKAAIATAFTPEEAISGLTTLFQAGLNVESSMSEAIEPTLILAQVGREMGLSVEGAAKAVSISMNAFPDTFDKPIEAVDRLMRGAQLAMVEFGAMPDVLGKMGGAAALTGQSFDSLFAVFLASSRIFPQSKRLATQMFATLSDLSTPRKREELEKAFNIPILAGGKMRSLVDIVSDLSSKMNTMGQKGADVLSDVIERSSAKFLADAFLTLKNGVQLANGEVVFGAEVFRRFIVELENSAETAEKTAETMRSSFLGIFAQLSEAFTQFLAEIGAPLLAVAKSIIWVIKDISEHVSLSGFVLKAMGSTLMFVVAGFIALIAPALMVFGILSLMSSATGFLGKQMEKLGLVQLPLVRSGFLGVAAAGRAVGVVMKGLGWLAIILLAVDLLQWLGDTLGLIPKAQETDASKAVSASKKTYANLLAGSEAIGEQAGELNKAVEKYKSILMPKTPRFYGDTPDLIRAATRRASESSPQFRERGGALRMEEQLKIYTENVAQMREDNRAGLTTSKATMHNIMGAAKNMASALNIFTDEDKATDTTVDRMVALMASIMASPHPERQPGLEAMGLVAKFISPQADIESRVAQHLAALKSQVDQIPPFFRLPSPVGPSGGTQVRPGISPRALIAGDPELLARFPLGPVRPGEQVEVILDRGRDVNSPLFSQDDAVVKILKTISSALGMGFSRDLVLSDADGRALLRFMKAAEKSDKDRELR